MAITLFPDSGNSHSWKRPRLRALFLNGRFERTARACFHSSIVRVRKAIARLPACRARVQAATVQRCLRARVALQRFPASSESARWRARRAGADSRADRVHEANASALRYG